MFVPSICTHTFCSAIYTSSYEIGTHSLSTRETCLWTTSSRWLSSSAPNWSDPPAFPTKRRLIDWLPETQELPGGLTCRKLRVNRHIMIGVTLLEACEIELFSRSKGVQTLLKGYLKALNWTMSAKMRVVQCTASDRAISNSHCFSQWLEGHWS